MMGANDSSYSTSGSASTPAEEFHKVEGSNEQDRVTTQATGSFRVVGYSTGKLTGEGYASAEYSEENARLVAIRTRIRQLLGQ